MTKQYVGSQNNIDDLEAKVKELEEARTQMNDPDYTPEIQEADEASKNESLPEEERTWAKRQADSQRYIAKLRREAQAEREALRQELEAARAEAANVSLPTTAEELEKLQETNPEIYRAMTTIARQEAGSETSTTVAPLKEKIASLEKERDELAKREALASVKAVHKDFDQINGNPEFWDWLKDQPKAFEDVVVNSVDPKGTITVINAFKAEKGLLAKEEAPKRQRRKKQDADAAAAVMQGGSATPTTTPDGKKIWTSTEVARMRPDQYEKYAEEIDEARRDGRYVHEGVKRKDLFNQ